MKACWCWTPRPVKTPLRRPRRLLQVAKISGLVMTKLDGTARGGSLVAIAQKLALPIYFIGVGEQAEDLQAFDAAAFAAGADRAG